MIPIIGTLVDAGVSLFKSYFPPDLTPAQKAQLEAGEQKFKETLTASLINYNQTILEQQASIVRAEAQSQSWLARNWRPITMLVFVVIIANNYILYPYLGMFTAKATILKIPPDMWQLLKIGIGGYVIGRSVEKSVGIYTKKEK